MNFPPDYYPDESHALSSVSSPGLVELAYELAEQFGHDIGGFVQLRPTALLYGPFHSRYGYGPCNGSSYGQFRNSYSHPDNEVPLSPHETVFCAGCRHCGMRCWIIPGERLPMSGALFSTRCDGDALRAVETRASLLGESHAALKVLLQNEIGLLTSEHEADFDPGEYDYFRQRWLSNDGALALQWTLRADPFLPIDEENPQSFFGLTRLLSVIPEEVLMPAQYEGPLLNPNGCDDEELWDFDPLEPGETGVAYRDDLGRLRFRREDGVLGFFVHADDLRIHGPWLHFDSFVLNTSRSEEIIHPDDTPLLYP